jgi:myo-inositol-1(or 4)-monophosphatase
MNLELIAQQIEPIIVKTGELLLSYFQDGLTKHYKQDGSFATQADIQAERFLIEHLKNLVPGAGFFAEESGLVQGNQYCWVIDPLDGTTNFAQGLPYFCISVALTEYDKPVIGFVYQPLLRQMFKAILGSGAFFNGTKFSIAQERPLKESVIIFAFPYEQQEAYFSLICEVEKKVYTARNFGAAALDQAYCAAGKVDGVLFCNLSWWDIAAGMLLITEAGGQVMQFDGLPVTRSYQSFLAGNKLICDEVVSLAQDLL